mmetsp:Transcript_8059/g.20347  ORF Transcript_8059/g.20347 Transcript_8059/m.20347 type:complete len:249 (-) Transcript_8059:809-1555(-)
MLAWISPLLCAAIICVTTVVAFRPAFSAKVRGTTSRASANLLIAYCSRPGVLSARVRRRTESSVSVAPAPGTKRASRVIPLYTLTASSMQRSMSSSKFEVAARTSTVTMRSLSAFSWRKTHTFVLPISSMPTESTWPRSLGVGRLWVTTGWAPVAVQTRRMSNLLWSFSTMSSYLSRKCSAISLTASPLTTTFTPMSASCLTRFSSSCSSSLLKERSCSALSMVTTPLASVLARSTPRGSTATLALVA